MVNYVEKFLSCKSVADVRDMAQSLYYVLGDNRSDVTEKMKTHMETVNGVDYIQVHPTYLYESLWCMMVLIIMLLYRKHKKFDGEVFLVYLLGYGLGRVWIEGLRTDQLLLPVVVLPVSQILAGVIVVVSTILIIYHRWKVTKE